MMVNKEFDFPDYKGDTKKQDNEDNLFEEEDVAEGDQLFMA